eukprot:gene2641-5183_t
MSILYMPTTGDSQELLTTSSPFFEKLHRRVESINSLLCVGLDPHSGQLSSFDAEVAVEFCLKIVEATHPYTAAYKPNAAFFEAFGAAGVDALQRVIRAIPKDIPVLLDVKRGDIETTAQAYADAAYRVLGAEAVTLSPYMGWDSIAPFVTGTYSTRAVFVLCKTSNPSSKELQEQKLSSGSFLYEEVASMSTRWNDKAAQLRTDPSTHSWGSVGLVAGATDLPALGRVRAAAPTAWILCPGVGAQGGEADAVCAVGLRTDGSGLLVSVSRGISAAKDMAAAAIALRDTINVYRTKKISDSNTLPTPPSSEVVQGHQKEFLEQALTCGALQFGLFKLKSGRESPYFFNAGLFCGGKSFRSLGRAYAQAVHQSGVSFDVIFGPAYKGIPLATALAMSWAEIYGEDKDVCYNRKEVKDHGEATVMGKSRFIEEYGKTHLGGMLVGAAVKGRRVLIVDDVITAGTAIREALDILQHEGAVLAGVVVALDRQEFATTRESGSAIQQVQKEQGVPVMAIVQLKHLVSFVAGSGVDTNTAGAINTDNLTRLRSYRDTYGVDY